MPFPHPIQIPSSLEWQYTVEIFEGAAAFDGPEQFDINFEVQRSPR
jgi:hypothetical protein